MNWLFRLLSHVDVNHVLCNVQIRTVLLNDLFFYKISVYWILFLNFEDGRLHQTFFSIFMLTVSEMLYNQSCFCLTSVCARSVVCESFLCYLTCYTYIALVWMFFIFQQIDQVFWCTSYVSLNLYFVKDTNDFSTFKM